MGDLLYRKLPENLLNGGGFQAGGFQAGGILAETRNTFYII
ncbi:MAG: hypothetical protein ACXAEU_19660 [Candidatus Hodarchaeales archaeon]|jgi:hypothetical protein